MTTPPPGQALTAETVKLLVKGDLLRVLAGRSDRLLSKDQIVTFLRPARHPACVYLNEFASDWNIDRFTFIGRPDADGWIAWSGGDNPVPGGWIEVEHRGHILGFKIGWGTADNMNWSQNGSNEDIIAFRLASQSTAPTRGEGDYTMALAAVQPFEQFPDLAAHVERMATGGRLGSQIEWDGFLRSLNAALAPTPPEPVASALADGEGLEVVAWEIGFPGMTLVTPNMDLAFQAKERGHPIKPLVTAEAAAARIAALNAEVERWISAYKIAHDQATQNGQRAAQAEARADRLVQALDDARSTLDAINTPLTTDRPVAGAAREAVRRIDEALREPKSGGGE